MKKTLKTMLAVLLTAALLVSATPALGFARAIKESDTDAPSVETSTDSTLAEFTLSYYLNANESYGETQKYKEGQQIVPPAAPEKEGYVFAGWVIGKTEGNNEEFIPLPEKMPAENLVAYASWELAELKISFFSDGNEVSSSKALYGSDLSKLIPEDPKKEGYKFGGWFDENGVNVHSLETVPSKDTVFTAKWLRNGNVTFLVDGKTYEAYSLTQGQTLKIPKNPEKFGHKFVKWNPEVPSIMPAEDLTFEAVFEVDKDFVTLVIGGTLIAGGVIAGIAGSGALAITGVSIIGGIIALLGLSSIGKDKQYTVTYSANGSVHKTYKVKAGEKVPVPENPKRAGYYFAGWSPEVPKVMPEKNLSFVAKWSSDPNAAIPDTGSGSVGLTAFAMLGLSSVLFKVLKKKNNEE